MTSRPESFFAADYYEARDMFLAAADLVGARISSVKHPKAKGPQGRDIFMDCAVLGHTDAPHAVVVISGTHGPEGYCGSGVQVGLLREGLAQEWAKSMRIIFIHSHNAYGFAWDTRFNEDNIDLNRNYLESFDAPLPVNDNYSLLAQWAAPHLRDGDTVQDAERGLFGFAAEHGFPALQSALSGGQYTHPKGVLWWRGTLLVKHHFAQLFGADVRRHNQSCVRRYAYWPWSFRSRRNHYRSSTRQCPLSKPSQHLG